MAKKTQTPFYIGNLLEIVCEKSPYCVSLALAQRQTLFNLRFMNIHPGNELKA